jgi:hypothetical protein
MIPNIDDIEAVAEAMRSLGIRRLRYGGLEIQMEPPEPERPPWEAPSLEPRSDEDMRWAASGLKPSVNMREWYAEHGGKRNGE